jgi:hypothetical protein
MANLVCGGAMLQCSFGQAPSVLMTRPLNKVMCTLPAANIMDNKPFVNIMPFAMCYPNNYVIRADLTKSVRMAA